MRQSDLTALKHHPLIHYIGPTGPQGASVFTTNHAMYSSTLTQNTGGTTAANLITFDTTVHESGVSIASNQITIATAGAYKIDLRILCSNPTFTTDHTLTLWYKINNSATNALSSHVTVFKESTISLELNRILVLAAGNTVSFYWHSTDSAAALLPKANTTNPDRPIAPSALLTIFKIQ
jgi:hypothetical protein